MTDPTIRAGRVVFNTLIPNTDPCGFGGNGWVMEVDVMTGNRYDTPTFDTNGDGQISIADLVTSNGTRKYQRTADREHSRGAGFPLRAPVAACPPQREQIRQHVVGHGQTSWRAPAGRPWPQVLATNPVKGQS